MPNAYVLLSIGCNAYTPEGSIYILYIVVDAVEDAFCARVDARGGVVMDAVDDTFGVRIDVCSSLVLGRSCLLRGNYTSNQKLACFVLYLKGVLTRY